jgi:hypothetical protein
MFYSYCVTKLRHVVEQFGQNTVPGREMGPPCFECKAGLLPTSAGRSVSLMLLNFAKYRELNVLKQALLYLAAV